MAICRPNIYEHNNPLYPIVDSDFLRGGFRTAVSDVTGLYALSPNVNQLKERSTIVYVTGEAKYYILKDITQVSGATGWEEFVAGGAGTLTGATNGLSVSGKDVVLGGSALTGDTSILFDSTTQQIIIADTTNGIGFFAGCNMSSDPSTIMYGSLYSYISVTSGVTDIVQNNGFEETNIGICSSEIKVNSNASGFVGIEYGTDFSANYTPLSLITYKDLTGATSGITGTITGGTNGLGEVGKDVCLGGALLNNTTINPNGYNLNISGTTGSILSFVGTNPTSSYSCSSVSSDYVTLETQSAGGYAYVDLSRTGNSITAYASNGNICFNTNCKILITAPSGATYTGDYESNFTSRSLVTKRYVDESKNIESVRYYNIQTCTPPLVFQVLTSDGFIGVTGYTTGQLGTLCLPLSPICGQKVIVSDIQGDALSYPILICGNGKDIGANGCAQINTDYGSITLLYNGYCWSPIAFVN